MTKDELRDKRKIHALRVGCYLLSQAVSCVTQS